MGRENKKETIATLHRQQIANASERLFSEKGFAQTTIEDISLASAYSRRTIYAYFESKEDILHYIIAKGLLILKQDIENALRRNKEFLDQYFAICNAMKHYQIDCPHSSENITKARTSRQSLERTSSRVTQILTLGTEINTLLASFIQDGKEQGVVRKDIIPMWTVYILWSGINSLLTLVQTKGAYIAAAFSTTEEAYLEYGFKQIANSILETRIS